MMFCFLLTFYPLRLFVVDRKREGTEEVPMERVQIVGTTGNLYEVVIGPEPWCTCPDSEKGNQCKHIIYVSFKREFPPI